MFVSIPPPVSCDEVPLALSELFAIVLSTIDVCAPALEKMPPPSAFACSAVPVVMALAVLSWIELW